MTLWKLSLKLPSEFPGFGLYKFPFLNDATFQNNDVIFPNVKNNACL